MVGGLLSRSGFSNGDELIIGERTGLDLSSPGFSARRRIATSLIYAGCTSGQVSANSSAQNPFQWARLRLFDSELLRDKIMKPVQYPIRITSIAEVIDVCPDYKLNLVVEVQLGGSSE